MVCSGNSSKHMCSLLLKMVENISNELMLLMQTRIFIFSAKIASGNKKAYLYYITFPNFYHDKNRKEKRIKETAQSLKFMFDNFEKK